MGKWILGCFMALLWVQLTAQSWNWVNQTTSKSFARFDAIAIDPNGYSYVCGVYNDSTWFDANVLVTPAPWTSYGFVAKYSPTGTCIWVKTDSLKLCGRDIVIDADRNSYVLGIKNSQFYLAKWDSSGTKLWDSLLPANASPYKLLMSANGTCWMSGQLTAGQAIFGNDTLTGPAGFIAEYDLNGNALQAFPIGRTGKITPDYFVQDASGNTIVAAYLNGADTIINQPFGCQGSTLLMLKFDSNHNLVWFRDWQAPAFGNAYGGATGMCIDAQDNCYVTTGFLDQDFVLGTDTLFADPGKRTCAVMKYDPNGDLTWMRQWQFNGTGSGFFLAITCDQNQVYFTGYVQEDFSIGTVSVTDTSNTYFMFYMMALDLSGNALYEAHTTGNTSQALPRDIAVDNTGKIWISGMHQNAPAFGPFVMNDQPSGVDYGFLLQMNGSGVGIAEPVFASEVRLMNGAEAQTFTLQTDAALAMEDADFVLYDVTGRVVKTVPVNDETTVIDCRDVATGVYTWAVESGEERFGAGKVVNR